MSSITVVPISINREAETTPMERFPGSNTTFTPGLGHGGAEIMEAYEVTYPEHRARRYGTVAHVSYSRTEDSSYQRIIVVVCLIGTVDLIKLDDQITGGPQWTTMQKDIALGVLKRISEEDIAEILSQISQEAAEFITELRQSA